MGYKEDLNALVDRYYNDVLGKYKVTTMGAAQKGKKLSLFRKQDYKPYVAGFREHQADAQVLLEEAGPIQVDSDDKYGTALKDMLITSLQDFAKLCERNAEHYDLMERKQYSGSGISTKDIQLSFAGVNAALGPAMESLDILDRAHKLFNGEDVQVEEEDLLEVASAQEENEE